MDLWHIRGGTRLEGSCSVQGSKNATLPILAASILCPLRCELYRVPRLRDVDAALRILRHLGCTARQTGGEVYIDSSALSCSSIPHELMAEMRSSVIFMGALIARCGEARLSLPGGCQLGRRPIDLHLSALRRLGALIDVDGEEICCRPAKLKGAEIFLPFPSVGATENAMLAACGASGETLIRGAAREPEIEALQAFLRSIGAEVSGAGTETVRVCGFRPRRDAGYRVPPDRIVAASFACAAASAGGDVLIRGIDPRQFSTVLHFLNEAGCDIISSDHALRLRAEGQLRAVAPVITAPYPGFPTDAQPVLMAALLRAKGESLIYESIFENRFRQVSQLRLLGADITVEGRRARIRGVETLTGNALQASDLRGGASLILAGLSAQGETLVCDEGHITRGYEDFDRRLRELGADIVLEH